MRGQGNRSGRLDLKVKGLSRVGPGARVQTGRCRGRGDGQRRQRRLPGGRRQRRHGARPGARPLLASWRRVAGRRAAQRADVRSVRYSGPADTLWRLSGSEFMDLSGPVAIGADIRGRLSEPADRGLDQGPECAARKRGHRHGHRRAGDRSALRRSASDFQPPNRNHAGRRLDQRLGLDHLRRRRPRRSTSISMPPRRCCSTATTSRRGSPGRSPSIPTAATARSAASSTSTRVSSGLAGRPPGRSPSSTSATSG